MPTERSSLPRRKARTVTFEGERYRWVVSDGAAGVRLFVRRADGTGTRLEVPLRFELEGFYWFPVLGSPGPVTPNIVLLLMATARERGWTPTGNGGAFVFPTR